jgi:hypothetical protein
MVELLQLIKTNHSFKQGLTFLQILGELQMEVLHGHHQVVQAQQVNLLILMIMITQQIKFMQDIVQASI